MARGSADAEAAPKAAADPWVERELAKSHPLTEEQHRNLRRILLPPTRSSSPRVEPPEPQSPVCQGSQQHEPLTPRVLQEPRRDPFRTRRSRP